MMEHREANDRRKAAVLERHRGAVAVYDGHVSIVDPSRQRRSQPLVDLDHGQLWHALP